MKRSALLLIIGLSCGFQLERVPPYPAQTIYTFNHGDARDIIGNTSNNLTLYNGASAASGYLDTDGINDYAQDPTSSPVTGSEISITLWLWADSYTNTAFPAVAVQNYSSTGYPYTQWVIQVQNVSGAMRIAGGLSLGTSRVFSTSDGYTTGVWYHVALTYDGTTQRLYVDGVEVASTARTGSLATTTGKLQIGRWAGGGYFDGRVDDLVVWHKCISAPIVADLANGGRS